LVHKYLHRSEHFDLESRDWSSSQIAGPLSGANQALADIVFFRDNEIFNKTFGNNLKIVHHGYVLNSLRYFCSGGLNFRQILPTFLTNTLIAIEKLIAPIAKHWSLHQIIVIKKISN
jgi:hypothetical protein